MRTIISGGLIGSSGGAYRADVAIEDGKIHQIGCDLAPGDHTIAAGECILLPGGVDVHTHLDAPSLGMVSADDFRSGTIAAACGGTTTIIDFCQQEHGKSLAAGIEKWDNKASGKAAIDYGYHMMVVDLTDSVFEELARLPQQGIPSFKLFMAFKGGAMIDDLTLVRALDQAKRSGGLVMVHAENGDAAHLLQQRFLERGLRQPIHHALSRPARIEAEATARAIALAEVVGAPIYIVHVSCKEALEEVVRGKMRGAPVIAETCTQYLYLVQEDLDRPDFEGAKFVFTPPPRTIEDQANLWRALANNLLETVSSDHSSTNFRGQKDNGREDFTLIPNGLPGIEERLTMLYQGVVQGKITLDQFVDLSATRPARTFGLYPRKGAIAVGADADLVVFDPDVKWTIKQERLHHGVDYSAYEGQEVRGRVRDVLLRGKVIVEGGQYVGKPGEGEFVQRAAYGTPQ